MTENIEYCELSNETVVEISGNVIGFGGCSRGVCNTVVVASNTTIDASYFFEECPILQEVSLGEKCSFRGDNIFAGCSSLKKLNAPSGFRLVGNATFAGCGFRELVIPKGTIIDGNYSFGECLYLVSVIIEDGVVISRNQTFANCPKLSIVRMGNGVQILGDETFINCERLETLHVGDDFTMTGKNNVAGCRNISTSTHGKNISYTDDSYRRNA